MLENDARMILNSSGRVMAALWPWTINLHQTTPLLPFSISKGQFKSSGWAWWKLVKSSKIRLAQELSGRIKNHGLELMLEGDCLKEMKGTYEKIFTAGWWQNANPKEQGVQGYLVIGLSGYRFFLSIRRILTRSVVFEEHANSFL